MNQNKKMSKKKYLILAILFVFLLILAGIAVSYAFFDVTVSNSYTPTNAIVNLDCIDISYTEENTIDLDYNYPISDDYALSNITPVTIKVTNNCTTNIDSVDYTLALTTLQNSTGSISDDKIRLKVDRQLDSEDEDVLHSSRYLNRLDILPKGDILTYLNSDLDNRDNVSEYTNRTSYILDNGSVADGKTNIYKVYLWIDYYEGNSQAYEGKEHDESFNNTTQGLKFAAAISLVVNPTRNVENSTGTAFAIYSETDKSLMFYKNNDVVSVGSTYNGKTVTAIYTGFEDDGYESVDERPWADYSDVIETVNFVDEISPLSTAYWFADFYYLEFADLTNLNTSKVTDMSYMFYLAGDEITDSFQMVGMDNWNTSNVTDMSGMFGGLANNASQFNIGNIENWNTSNVTDMSEMFISAGYHSNYLLDLNNWNVTNVENYEDFNFDVEEKVIAPSKFLPVYAIYSATDNSLTFMTSATMPAVGDTYKNNAITAVFSGFMNRHYSSSTNIPWASYATVIESVIVEDEISPTSTAHWFHNFLNCSSFELTKLDISKVSSTSSMFWDAGYNTEVFQIMGLNNWNTSNVSDMYAMFYRTGYSASEFNIGDLSNWNIKKVTNTSFMFNNTGYSASEFNIGDLSNWDTKNIILAANMFNNAGYSASEFNIGDLSNWNISQLTNMSYMFAGAGYNATDWYIGKLSNWDTSSVTNIKYVFSGAGYNATSFELDLSKWNTRNVTNMDGAFYNTGRMSSTYSIGNISNWDTRNVTNMYAMFNYAGYSANYSLDLSMWNVKKVTNYTGFNNAVNGKIKSPAFGEY